jgi:sporulation protein YlmC with PRC-barrel domain
VSTHPPTFGTSDAPPTYAGHDVIDPHGAPVGTVKHVIYDDQGVDAEYLVVDPGPLRSARYVPVAGSYFAVTDRIVVPWDKVWIRRAPKATGSQDLSLFDRRTLEVHYAS